MDKQKLVEAFEELNPIFWDSEVDNQLIRAGYPNRSKIETAYLRYKIATRDKKVQWMVDTLWATKIEGSLTPWHKAPDWLKKQFGSNFAQDVIITFEDFIKNFKGTFAEKTEEREERYRLLVCMSHKDFWSSPIESPSDYNNAKGKKNRSTSAEIENRNRAIVMAVAELQRDLDRLPSVDEVISRTKNVYSRQQIYDSAAYKDKKITRKSAKLTTEMIGSSVTGSEQFSGTSELRSKTDKRSKSDQAELDVLIEQQKKDDSKDLPHRQTTA